MPNGGGDPYDWIGFDPRGVGSSEPSLSCDPDYFPFNRPDYVPVKRSDEKFWLKKSAGYAKACKQVGKDLVAKGSLLNHLKTTDTVNDMESIRKAFKQKQINYYGFSYGTTIGQTYATLHPNRVRRAVFDGVTDPSREHLPVEPRPGRRLREDREHLLHLGGQVRQRLPPRAPPARRSRKVWDKMLDKSRATPFDGKIGPDEWTDAFLGAGYYVYGWEDTADAFAAAVNGNYGPVEELYTDANGAPGPGSDNGFAVYLGTQCTDEPWPSSYAKIRRDNFRIYAKAPFETWANAWFNGPCKDWAGKAAKKKTVDRRVQGRPDPADRGDLRRGDAVPRRAGGAQALPEVGADRGRQRQHPRGLAVRASPAPTTGSPTTCSTARSTSGSGATSPT